MPLTRDRDRGHDRAIATWLLLCAAVVFGMIILGGVTRLTNSGLSMVEWKPLMGAIPPITEEAWQETFSKYKQFPEYQKVNRGMDLDGFKAIFMFEYLHRLLGRMIGVLFFFPMVFFAFRGWVRAGVMPKLWMLFVLGGMQGLLGWFMVKSGLVDNPRVSQYRLTAHLGLAVLIYGALLWVALDLLFPRRGAGRPARAGAAMAGLVYLMILSGGLVAGTRAGFAFSTWPLMGSSFVPPGLYATDPAWLAAFEDITTIQFNHRIFAYTLFALLHGFAFQAWRKGVSPRALLGLGLMLAALWLQVCLGISTLLLHVPVWLAAAHQGGAVLLLSAVLFTAHALRESPR
ncbi:COX15/CtaA family protein [Haliea sp. E17]|uniref:COX15/CtaA family protein n=1 Tax=Haliea sp. E17 TaxID=3401576 RepID=UPI003AAA9CC7